MTHWDKEHLDEGTLQAWLDRDRSGLDAEEAAGIERHLAECARCAGLRAEMEALDERAREILESGTPVDAEPPEYEAVLARSRQEAAEHSKRRERPTRSRWIGLAWAASLAVAVGVGWLGSEMLAPDRVVLETPAESEPATEPPEADAPASEETKAPAEPGPATPAAPVVAMDSATPDSSAPADRRAVAAPVVAQADVSSTREEGAEGEVVVQGVVTDGSTGEPLAGAQVYVPGTGRGTLSQEDGSFAISMPRGDTAMAATREIPLIAELIGYHSGRAELAPAGADTVAVDFRLPQEAVALDAVVVEGVQRAPSPTADAEASPGPEAAPGLADTLAPATLRWSPVTRAEASTRTGFAPLAVPELEILGFEVGDLGGVPAIRVRQALDSGAVLTLIQRRDPDGRVGWVHMDDRPAFSVRRGEILVTGSVPVPRDSLPGLMERLRRFR